MDENIVQITVSQSARIGTYGIGLSFPLINERLVWEDVATWESLSLLGGGYIGKLEALQRVVGQGVDYATAGRELERLFDFGLSRYYAFLGDDAVRRAHAIEVLLRRSIEWGARQRPQLVDFGIEINCVVEDVPIEIFPMFNVSPSFVTARKEELIFAASAMAGFAAAIRRVTNRRIPQNTRLEGQSLATSFYWYWGLGGAQTERDTLLRNRGVLFDGPWPTRPPRREFLARWRRTATPLPALADRIVSPPAQLLRDGTKGYTHVVHLSCHCSSGAAEPEDDFVELGGPSHRAILRLGLLAKTVGRVAQDHENAPIALLNACGGGRAHFASATSIPVHFLQVLNYRAVVGPLLSINDDIAQQFSEAFYLHLLRGQTVGMSIKLARLDLLRRGQPVGIAYVCYGESQLRFVGTQATTPGQGA